MISLKYFAELKRIIQKYQRGDYQEGDVGRGCVICVGKEKGKRLYFFEENEKSERMDLAHEKCIETLLKNEELEIFIKEQIEKIAEVNLKLISRNN